MKTQVTNQIAAAIHRLEEGTELGGRSPAEWQRTPGHQPAGCEASSVRDAGPAVLEMQGRAENFDPFFDCNKGIWVGNHVEKKNTVSR
jgi:hypothetical protein